MSQVGGSVSTYSDKDGRRAKLKLRAVENLIGCICALRLHGLFMYERHKKRLSLEPAAHMKSKL